MPLAAALTACATVDEQPSERLGQATLRLANGLPVGTAQLLTNGLGEAEFSIPGHIVADIAVEGAMVEHLDGAVSLRVEALTVEE